MVFEFRTQQLLASRDKITSTTWLDQGHVTLILNLADPIMTPKPVKLAFQIWYSYWS